MKFAAMTALTLTALCLAFGASAGEGTVQVTKYTMKDIDGKDVDLASYQGKVADGGERRVQVRPDAAVHAAGRDPQEVQGPRASR